VQVCTLVDPETDRSFIYLLSKATLECSMLTDLKENPFNYNEPIQNDPQIK